jgi:hypothetical protein
MNLARLVRRALIAAPLLFVCSAAVAPEPAPAGLLSSLLKPPPRTVVVETTGIAALPLVQKTLGLLGWTTTWRYDAGNLLVAKPGGLLSSTIGTVLSVLNALTGVRRAEENLLYSVDGRFGGEQSQAPVFSSDLNSASMRFQEAIDVVEGRGPVPPAVATASVAVIDGGFDLDHEALAGRCFPGFDVIAGDDDPTDRGNGRDDDGDGAIDGGLGHGTAVASVVLTLAPTVRVYPVRALDDEGGATTASLAAAIDWAIRQGVNVINISAGSTTKSTIVDQQLYRASSAGIQVVGSAGNSGDDGVSYPARSPYSIAVTGVSDDLVRTAEASYGVEVDAGAPSVRIVAPFPRTTTGYGYWTGTSFAAPLFSATVALGVQSGLGRAKDVAARALQTAAPYAYISPECSGEVGKGIVSVRATLGQ